MLEGGFEPVCACEMGVGEELLVLRWIGVPLAHGGGCAIGAGPWRARPIGVPSCRTLCDRHRLLQHVNAGAHEAS